MSMPSAAEWDSPGRRLALGAVLLALGLTLSRVDRMIPLTFVPIPGFRIGLSNVVTLFALFRLPGAMTWSILLMRCLLGALFGGGISALLLSLSGGILALLVMQAVQFAARRLPLSVFGVSVAGACAHNIGQVLMASLLLESWAPLWYLPYLLWVGVVCGLLIAALCAGVLKRFALEGRHNNKSDLKS